ncbi:SDR family NAD(P)-dependent oxidoreductase [Mycolicibacterium peregrinum]|uniref:Short-chain dehydrogenase n=1 Tax=Mycolicibacterium peregrinum TaxID=43304 RepID=A0A1A0VCB4_MYCPR|nr:SDR family NAD(P)-dependent oxidoreductase [Mycolicibacterium peregrinum]OBB80887.1 short-chain dehydrogenase [Mycolicibacterium peregrinum]
MSDFADRYGPWALVAGASDGVGSAMAEELARRGLNVVLLARRQGVLDDVAAAITARTGAQTRTLAIDLATPEAAGEVIAATEDLDIGFLVYCAGAESLVQRNCLVPMQLCHHYAQPMVERGRGGIVIFGSGAGFAGGPNMVAYGASKAFDMVFAEALWTELQPSGVDVLGLILGKTDTPALRKLEHERGQISSPEHTPPGAAAVDDVVAAAFANLSEGPTCLVGPEIQAAAQLMASVSRNDAVRFIAQAVTAAMGAN